MPLLEKHLKTKRNQTNHTKSPTNQKNPTNRKKTQPNPQSKPTNQPKTPENPYEKTFHLYEEKTVVTDSNFVTFFLFLQRFKVKAFCLIVN